MCKYNNTPADNVAKKKAPGIAAGSFYDKQFRKFSVLQNYIRNKDSTIPNIGDYRP